MSGWELRNVLDSSACGVVENCPTPWSGYHDAAGAEVAAPAIQSSGAVFSSPKRAALIENATLSPQAVQGSCESHTKQNGKFQ